MNSYKPTGRISLSGLLIMIVFGISCAVCVSLALQFFLNITFIKPISFLLIGLFTFVMGGTMGVCGESVCKVSKCRNPLVAAGIGILLAWASYCSFHYFSYSSFKRELLKVNQAHTENILKSAKKQDFVDELFKRSTGKSGFAGYIIFKIEKGKSIFFKGKECFYLDKKGMLALYLLQLFVIMGFAISACLRQSYKPFCEDCQQWLESKDICRAPLETAEDLIKYVKERDFEPISKIATTASETFSEIKLNYCNRCKKGIVSILKGKCLGNNSQAREEVLFVDLLNNSETQRLMSI